MRKNHERRKMIGKGRRWEVNVGDRGEGYKEVS